MYSRYSKWHGRYRKLFYNVSEITENNGGDGGDDYRSKK